jgi:esterase/lipase
MPGFIRSKAAAFALSALVFSSGLMAGCSKAAPDVHFRTEDGFLLEGRIYGSGPKAVILAHMYPADQSSWARFARKLAGDGYQALTFNFRGYPGSEGAKDIALIDRDVRGAVRYMTEKKGATSVALIGASMGGTASLIAAVKAPVAGVVTLSAPVEFKGLDASRAVSAVTAPKLFIASQSDPSGAAAAAQTLFTAAADPRDIQIIPGDAHGAAILSGPQGAEVESAIMRFLNKTKSG